MISQQKYSKSVHHIAVEGLPGIHWGLKSGKVVHLVYNAFLTLTAVSLCVNVCISFSFSCRDQLRCMILLGPKAELYFPFFQ